MNQTFNMSDTGCLKDRAHSSILAAENLLAKMTTTTKIKQHIKHLHRMSELTHKVEDDLIGMIILGGEYATNEELKALGDSIIDIGRRTSALYKDL